MLRDAEVSAALFIRLTASIPGLDIQPGDDTPEGLKAASLIRQVMDAMPGSFVDVVRNQIFKEGLTTGLAITEPVQDLVDLPDFNKVFGLKALKVARSEDFQQGIHTDDYGNITGYTQKCGTSSKPINPGAVLYYAHDGCPANRLGVSCLQPAYDPWILKGNLFKLYAIFATVNASGLRIASIPDDDFHKDKDTTLARMKKLAEHANLVKPLSQKLEIQIPPGTAGFHFINGIRELANKEIRKAIIYDESLNAEGMHTGSYASKRVSQSVVYEAMAVEGFSFCEDVLREQLFKMILTWNDMGDYPLPLCVPEPTAKKDADIAPILQSLSTAKTAGLLTVPLPDTLQKQIYQKSLAVSGIKYNAMEDKSVTPEKQDPPPPAKEEEPPPNTQEDLMAGAPKGRGRADILRLKKEAIKREEEGLEAVSSAWAASLPGLKQDLNDKLFNDDGTWKTKNYKEIRRIVEKAIPAGGAGLKKILTDISMVRRTEGIKDAKGMLPVEAAVNLTPVTISPADARDRLANNIQLTLRKTYGELTDEIYHILDNTLAGGIAPREAMSQVAAYLTEHGLSGAAATTLVNTSLASAYNGGRMAIYSQLADPDGLKPGGIIGFQFSAIMDNVTTDICVSYDGKFFRVDDPSLPEPPLHFNCRSILIPVFTGETPWAGGAWEGLGESKALTKGIAPGFGGN